MDLGLRLFVILRCLSVSLDGSKFREKYETMKSWSHEQYFYAMCYSYRSEKNHLFSFVRYDEIVWNRKFEWKDLPNTNKLIVEKESPSFRFHSDGLGY